MHQIVFDLAAAHDEYWHGVLVLGLRLRQEMDVSACCRASILSLSDSGARLIRPSQGRLAASRRRQIRPGEGQGSDQHQGVPPGMTTQPSCNARPQCRVGVLCSFWVSTLRIHQWLASRAISHLAFSGTLCCTRNLSADSARACLLDRAFTRKVSRALAAPQSLSMRDRDTTQWYQRAQGSTPKQ